MMVILYYDQDMHTIGRQLFKSRLLAKVLCSSLTDDFHQTMINFIPPHLHSDGTYILWAISHHVHQNNMAFLENVHEQIINTTLAQFDNDILKYIMSIKNKSCMISSPITSSQPSQAGLFIYVLCRLILSLVLLFQLFI